MEAGRPYTLDQIKKEFPKLQPSNVRKGLGGKQFKPELPAPKPERSSTRRISYNKDMDDIQTVGDYLFGDEKVTPSQVGEKCFDLMMEEAQQ